MQHSCNQLDALKTAEIFSAIDTEDVDRLKSLLDAPQWYTVEQNHRTILQYAILEQKYAIFDFLMSIEDFPVDATCKANLTPLIRSLGFQSNNHRNLMFVYPPQSLALQLLRKGANIHQVDDEGNSVLHLAVQMPHYRDVCHFVLENGIDVNAENDQRQTALRVRLNCETNERSMRQNVGYEILLMLLYYNADICPFNDRQLASDLFNWALSEATGTEIPEILYFYLVDLISDLKVCILDLIEMMLDTSKKHLLTRVLDHDLNLVPKPMHFQNSQLFCIDGDFLRILIEKFAHVIDELLKFHSCGWRFNSKSIENFEILFNSVLASSRYLRVRCKNGYAGSFLE